MDQNITMSVRVLNHKALEDFLADSTGNLFPQWPRRIVYNTKSTGSRPFDY